MRLGVLERVGILLRANLPEILARADDPRETLREVIVDIQNQLLQVKSRMAVALSDQLALERKGAESAEKAAAFLRKAAAAGKGSGNDEAAKRALGEALSHRRLCEKFTEQVREQKLQVDALRSAFLDLEHKLTEVKGGGELLLAEQKRAAQSAAADGVSAAARKAPARRVEKSRRKHVKDAIDQLLLELERSRRA